MLRKLLRKLLKFIFIFVVLFAMNFAIASYKHSKKLSTKLSSTQKTPKIFSENKQEWIYKTCNHLVSQKDDLLLHNATQESCVAVAKSIFDSCLKNYELSAENLTQRQRLEKFTFCFAGSTINKLHEQEA